MQDPDKQGWGTPFQFTYQYVVMETKLNSKCFEFKELESPECIQKTPNIRI